MSKRIKCLGTCGRELLLSNSNFYKSNNSEFEKYNGFAPYCKGCLRSRIFDENGLVDIDKFKDTLRILNKPFIRSIFEELMNDGIALGDYTKRLNFGEYRNMTYADSDKDGLSKDDIEIPSNLEHLDITKQDLLNFQNRWGKGFEADEYVYLEEQYEDLCKHYRSDDSYAMQLIFEEACHTRLTIKRKRERGDDVNKELKTLQDLLASANIKPNQETSAGNVEKGSFGMFIKKIEEEEPIPRWEEDLGGEDKISKYIRIFFFGNLAKALNIRNPWQTEFDDEMKQYTVDLSEVEQEDEGEDILGDR